ncbi:cytochrome P450 71D9-like [Morus notabilis]|uniref:cytochrome P450 71D9-like n=1 Tax=Morus notabilis TaxID=981085 RepID=UPI000CED447C|nr:cytochrome P450 71D9-like [Morus notabilis]
MELKLPSFANLFTFFLFVFMLLKIFAKRAKIVSSSSKLPPGTRKLSFVGNMLQLLGSDLAHHTFRDLAIKHGPFVYLKIGQVPTVVVLSPEFAKEVLRTHDTNFAFRPRILFSQIVLYDCNDISFAPYGEFWKQLRKICMQELLSTARVQSFKRIREEEVFNLMEWVASNVGSAINLTKRIQYTTYSIISWAALDGDSEQHLTSK